MGKSSSAPAAPDPTATAAAQGAANKDTAVAQAELNAVNQNTPYGSLTYSSTPNPNDPSLPQYTATTTLSPAQQQLLDTTQGAQQGAANSATNYVNTILNNSSNSNPYGGVTPLNTDYTQMGQQATNDLQSLEQPTIDHNNEMFNSQLANQGIVPGSDAYNYAQLTNSNSNNNLTTQNALAGMQEEQALASQNLSENQAGIQNVNTEQSTPINQLSALLSSSQVANPNYVSTPNEAVGANNVSGDIYNSYNGQLNAYNTQQASQNGLTSGLFGLGGTLGAAEILA